MALSSAKTSSVKLMALDQSLLLCAILRTMLRSLAKMRQTFLSVFIDALTFVRLTIRSRTALAAENLFLRKQLALYIERKRKPQQSTDSIRFTLAQLSKCFEWRNALTIVKPDTLIRWHRKGFRLFWKWKSRPIGRPPVPVDVQRLIVEMAASNLTWGEERIANELLLKIGIQISPRTVRRYMPNNPRRPADPLNVG